MNLNVKSPPASLALVLGLGFVTLSPSLHAQYSIRWQKISAGSGAAVGGEYAMKGTVGEAATGLLKGGAYTAGGGFWRFPAVVPTLGAPALTIALTPTNTALISWPSSASGWRLQRGMGFSSDSWLAAPETVSDDGTNQFVVVPPSVPAVFYRLSKP